MCNLYKVRLMREEVAGFARAAFRAADNRPAPGKLYPDYAAPVVLRNAAGARELRDLRWGMPSSRKALLDAATKRADKLRAKGTEFDFAELLKMEPDKGTTNVRNTASAHWRPWLGPANRCLVPFTAFSEPDQDLTGSKTPVWFATAPDEPLAFFAGIWTPHACVRAKSKGWEDVEAYGFLTTDSAPPVDAYHRKAMPVILTDPADQDLWLSDAPWTEVAHLQRPLPGAALTIVQDTAE